jgi:hypothetical protein
MPNSPIDDNRNPLLTGVSSINGTSPTSVYVNPTNHGLNLNTVSGINLGNYDYVSMALSAANTTETWTFKTGGSGGTTVSTVVIVYTDNTRAVILTVTKT